MLPIQFSDKTSVDTPVDRKDLFLDHRQGFPLGKIHTTRFPNHQRKPPPQHYSPKRPDLTQGQFFSQSTSPSLTYHLPHLRHLPHPTSFARLDRRAHHRPKQTLPARLRPLGQQRKVVDDASTDHFTTISDPILRRSGTGSHAVPPGQQPSFPKMSGQSPMQQQGLYTGTLAEFKEHSNSRTGQCQQSFGDTNTTSPSVGFRSSSPTTKQALRFASMEDTPTQDFSKMHSNRQAGQVIAQGMGQDKAQAAAERSQADTYRTVRTYDLLDKNTMESFRWHIGMPLRFATCSDGSTWFCGNWGFLSEPKDESSTQVIARNDQSSEHNGSLDINKANTALWMRVTFGGYPPKNRIASLVLKRPVRFP